MRRAGELSRFPLTLRTAKRLQKTFLRFRQVLLVDLEADEFFHAATFRGDRRISNPEKRIEHRFDTRNSVQLDAPFRQLHRERRGMWALFRPALNRLVWNEPGVATTAPVLSFCVAPPRDVALVGVGDAEGQSLDRRPAFRREMKNIFVAIIKESRRADRLEVASRNC